MRIETCSHCHTRVAVRSDGRCPSCNSNVDLAATDIMQTESTNATENPYAPPSVESRNSPWHTLRNYLWHISLIVVLSNSAYWHLSNSSAVGQLHRLQGVVEACGALSVGLLLSKVVNPGVRKRNRQVSVIAFLGLFTIGLLRFFCRSFFAAPATQCVPVPRIVRLPPRGYRQQLSGYLWLSVVGVRIRHW